MFLSSRGDVCSDFIVRHLTDQIMSASASGGGKTVKRVRSRVSTISQEADDAAFLSRDHYDRMADGFHDELIDVIDPHARGDNIIPECFTLLSAPWSDASPDEPCVSTLQLMGMYLKRCPPGGTAGQCMQEFLDYLTRKKVEKRDRGNLMIAIGNWVGPMDDRKGIFDESLLADNTKNVRGGK